MDAIIHPSHKWFLVAWANRIMMAYLCPKKHSHGYAVVCFAVCSCWRHQMETSSALLALCARNSPVNGEFPSQRPVTRSFDVFFDLCPDKRFSKQSWGWWFETLSRPLWRHSNVILSVDCESRDLVSLAYSWGLLHWHWGNHMNWLGSGNPESYG